MELSAFSRLEEKIDSLVRRMEELKAENQALRGDLEAKEKEAQELGELMAVLEAEREEVKSRIEGLVARLELI
ncbi:MAG: cell division protein ZapB [Deltaproteobacteria bacterium]|nr:cell division protein ZapB [Deltaproteobacteria bacterium]